MFKTGNDDWKKEYVEKRKEVRDQRSDLVLEGQDLGLHGRRRICRMLGKCESGESLVPFLSCRQPRLEYRS